MSDKKSSSAKWVAIVFFIILVLVVIAAVLLLTYEKKDATVSDHNKTEREVLVCTSGPTEQAFVSLSGASQVKHTVKAEYVDAVISKLFYSYSGKFKDATEAEKNSTHINIAYDEYLAKNNLSSSKYVRSTFNHIDTEVRVDIYTPKDGINSDTATFFFLESSKLNDLLNASDKELERYYKDLGFSCRIEK